MGRKNSKYRWMVFLMVSSQLLLMGFVAYWLRNQYRTEKRELHAKLTHEYIATQDQLIDSMLLRDLIKPTLSDSVIISMEVSDNRRMGIQDDTCRPSIMMKQLHMDSANDMHVFALRFDEANAEDSTVAGHALVNSRIVNPAIADATGAGSADTSRPQEEDLLVRSVRLFINRADESLRSDHLPHVFSMHVDSAIFQRMLEERFHSLGWNFSLTPAGTGIPPGAPGPRSGLELMGFSSQPAHRYLVSRVGGHIFRLILPEVLFGLVLLALSASALLIVHNSYRKQLTLNKMRDDFISNMSHELQTPVSTVKVALEALSTFDQKKDPVVTGEYLEMASREVERLKEMVGKVLEHNLLEDQSDWLRKEPCDLRELVRRIVRNMEVRAKERGARIRIIPEDGSFVAMADPVYTEGVITNLIDNSLKYAGPDPEIGVLLGIVPRGLTISVRDNGPGIPDEYRHKIFDKFFRIPKGDLHDVKGYGLGLNYAAQVMEQHRGSISHQNLPGGGCEFTLFFPGDNA